MARNNPNDSGSALLEQESVAEGIKNTWQEGTEAVSEAAETVKESVGSAVDSVKETVATTVDAVQESTQALGRAFDLSESVRRDPWLMFAGSVFLGFMLGKLLDELRS